MILPPETPTHVSAVELTEIQRSRLERLIISIWSSGSVLDHAGILAYAEMCFLKTVRRGEDGTFEDLHRVVMSSGQSMLVD